MTYFLQIHKIGIIIARTYDTSSMVMDKDFGNELNARM